MTPRYNEANFLNDFALCILSNFELHKCTPTTKKSIIQKSLKSYRLKASESIKMYFLQNLTKRRHWRNTPPVAIFFSDSNSDKLIDDANTSRSAIAERR